MKHYIKSLLALILALTLCTSLLAGCAGNPTPSESSIPSESVSPKPSEEPPPEEASVEPTEQPGPSGEAPVEPEPSKEPEPEPVYTVSYPISDEKIEMTIWHGAPNLGPLTAMNIVQSHMDYEIVKKAEEITNVHMVFNEPSFEVATEQFNLMVVSQDYPDLIAAVPDNYVGGVSKALDDEVIIDLSDYIAEFAPDYYNYIKDNDDIMREAKDDSGRMPSVFSLYDEAIFIEGTIMRADWLEKLGMDVPTNFDDLETVMKGMQTELDCQYPIFINQTCDVLTKGFDIKDYDIGLTTLPLFCEDGQVKCTFDSDRYLQYLQTLNKWYNDGLIYPSFMEYSSNPFAGDDERLIASDQLGVWNGMAPTISNYYIMNETEGFEVAGTFISASDSVDHITSSALFFGATSVSSQCEAVPEALMWLNFWYTEEGQMMCNYGTEGVDYTIEGGEVVFTDAIYNNEKGVDPMLWLRAVTIAGASFGRTLQSRNFVFYTEAQSEAVKTWTKMTDGSMAMPTTLSLSGVESERISELSTDITTYVSENIPKFIMGDLSFDKWDAYLAELENMKLSECIAIYQAAYERYLAR